jgi:hypothetical protein
MSTPVAKKRSTNGLTEFTSLIADHDRERMAKVVNGKTVQAMKEALEYIPGLDCVQEVTIDMPDYFKKNYKRVFFQCKAYCR